MLTSNELFAHLIKSITMKLLFIFLFGIILSPPVFSQYLNTDFEDGTLQGWTNTDVTTTGLSVLGAVDQRYLQKSADGSNSAIGKMAIINRDEYIYGCNPPINFECAASIDLMMRNTNSFDFHLRIGFTGADGSQAVLTNAVIFPANTNWQYLSLEILDDSNYTILIGTSTFEEIKADTFEIRIFHNPILSYEGAVTTGNLEIDSINTTVLLSTDEQSLEKINIFPNPASDFITLNISANDSGMATFYNILGQEVMTQELNSINTRIDISELNSGIYMLAIKTSEGSITKKLIKN